MQSLERALRILDGFGARALGASEVAREQGLSKSTAFRILSTLRRAGYVQQDPASGRYALGLRLLDLGEQVACELDVRRVARPTMFALAERARASVYLAVLFDGTVVNVEAVDSPDPVRVVVEGRQLGRVPQAIATGKVLLAALPPAERARVVAGLEMRALTPHTTTDPAAVLAELARVAEQGYALNDQEQVLGVRGVAAPVRNHRGAVVAALSVAAPTARLTRELIPRYAQWVRTAADDISGNLGADRAREAAHAPEEGVAR